MTAITKKAIPNRIKEKRTPGDWALDIFKVLFLAVITIITVYPFWNIFVVSINDATDAVRGGIYFWPVCSPPQATEKFWGAPPSSIPFWSRWPAQ